MKKVLATVGLLVISSAASACYQLECPVFVEVDRSAQTATVYYDGVEQFTTKVATGRKGYTTPLFDKHLNGRMYERYSSKKYPQGNKTAMGNMPYALFIHEGFALHGTPYAVGYPRSHGCVRIPMEHQVGLFERAREVGAKNVWVTVKQ